MTTVARAHALIAPCLELACCAHARQKFFDLFQNSQSPVAQEALNRLAVLYTIQTEGSEITIDELLRS